MYNFYHRFLILCDEKGILPQQAQKEIGIRSETFERYISGEVPNIKATQKILDYFQIDLTGLFPEATPFEVIKLLCSQRGISLHRATKEMGLSSSDITSLKKYKIPNNNLFRKLCGYFGITEKQFLIYCNSPLLISKSVQLTVFYRNFVYLCKRKQISQRKACGEMRISENPDWKNGSIPQSLIIDKIAAYFNVPADWLTVKDIRLYFAQQEWAELDIGEQVELFSHKLNKLLVLGELISKIPHGTKLLDDAFLELEKYRK